MINDELYLGQTISWKINSFTAEWQADPCISLTKAAEGLLCRLPDMPDRLDIGMVMKKVFVKPDVVKNLKGGHPWCFSGAVKRMEGPVEDGALCEVHSDAGYLGTGYYNSRSDIRVRILTRLHCTIDAAFFRGRIGALREQKEALLPPGTDSYRVVFGENDNLPGLVVDKYGDVLVVQVHTLGMERLKEMVVDALAACFKPRSIFERSDLSVRTREGLPADTRGVLLGEEPGLVVISESGYRFEVDPAGGQKTGFFLDQRENRRSIQCCCRGLRVLNCFSYTGGFSVYAAASGAEVTSVDISAGAVETARRNFSLNGMDPEKHGFVEADVFDYLKHLESGRHGMIILDPPSFAKNRHQLKNAIKAYTTINTMALQKLPETGILVTSSCTSHLDEQTFIKILHQSSVNAGCQLKAVYSSIQPFDHAYNLGFPEGRYLKFLVLQKLPVL